MNFTANIKELLSYRHVFSWKRAGNGFLVIASYFLSRWTNRPIIAPAPIAISVEPTTVCNLKCPQCPTGAGILQRSKGTMELSLYQGIIDKLSPNTFIANLYLQGEPLLNPAIGDFIKYAQAKRLYTIISTNGQLLDQKMAKKLIDSRLSKIIISLDGVTEQSYVQYRVGGSLQKVLEGIEFLRQEKLKAKSRFPFIEIQFIAFEHNQHELELVRKIARSYSVDKLTVKSAQIINSQSKVRSSTHKRLTRYVQTEAGFPQMKPSYRHCFKIWHSMVFTWDGTASPCCYDKDLNFNIGRVPDISVKDIWKGKDIQHFRRRILTESEPFSICSNCPENRKFLF